MPLDGLADAADYNVNGLNKSHERRDPVMR